MIELQIAVLGEDQAGIQDYLCEIDRKTESELFQRAGEHFGFKTVVVEGRACANRATISSVLGYQNESGVRMACQRHEIRSEKITAYAQNVRKLITEELELHVNDVKANLINWDGFLIAAMHSTTKEGKLVQKYLLECERSVRIANGIDLDLHKVRENQIKELDQVSRILARVDRIKDPVMKKAALAELNDVLGGTLKQHGMQFDLLNGESQ
ncbi:MAG: hypothetical protein ACR2PX_01095 [Endozoicomonas sp.]|uniref:hypothetical protein n=1 Tax=Endozoicomonas sp. TaxID=1892382 RepID=UPI003D9AE58F